MLNKIDLNFYSREIGAYGIETIQKLSKLKVLIYGLRGLGMEIAKNLILSGPKEVHLYDKNIITQLDLGSGYYFTKEQINKIKRDEGCLNNLSKLNSNVKVVILKDNLINSISNFDVIIISEIMKEDELFKINKICREKNIGFIYGVVFGLLGFIFVDFGKKFFIYDKYGNESKSFYINNITNGKNCIISIDPLSIENSFLSDDDYVKFKDIEGMKELNDKIRKIKVISNYQISIEDDTTNFGKYIKGGNIKEVKIPIEKNYKSLEDNFNNPICEEDFQEDQNSSLRHSLIIGLHKYFSKNLNLPELNNNKQALEVLQYSKNYFEKKIKEKNELFLDSELDENFIKDLAQWSRAEIPFICSFIGGIISQEIVKFTGKYIPLEQNAWFDFYDSVKSIGKVNRNLMNSRYDEQIAIYGQELQNKLFETNIFMIGAGALGCEYLKLFSLMGIATKDNKKIIVTDNDNIEISNLNRQFLFQKDSIGKNKAEIACKEIKKFNNNINCESQQNLVHSDTEDIYTEDFWKSQNIIINAVDNMKARKYIDYQCTLFNKILIDSGTEGTKANSQLIIPNISKCYNETHIADEKNKNIPMCTLRQFPSSIEHCIEWGKDKFIEYFNINIENLKNVLTNPEEFYKKIEDNEEKNIILNTIKISLQIKQNNDIIKCREYAIKIFINIFNDEIKKIINIFPHDYKNKDGTLFWNGAKKFPQILNYNKNDELSNEFIESFIKIMINALGIKINEQPKNIINENIIDKTSVSFLEDNETIKKDLIELTKNIDINSIKPEIFEKDNELNNHVNFIHACSNLRARNYHIEECDKIKVKLIAGKIIPAISSTTSAITGFVASQIYTLLYSNKIELFKEIRFNTATNSYFISQPQKIIGKENIKGRNKLIIAVPEKWTSWEHIEIKGSITIKEFFDYIKKKYNVIIKGMYTWEKISIVKNKEMLNMKIEEAYASALNKELSKLRKTLSFTIDGKNENKNSIIMPVFLYKF